MYKVVFFGIAFIITNFTNASAQTPPFTAERMLTDFAGVVTNGNTVLCYGNYGIITYSTDDGATWQQQTIGDKHNIKKIVALNGTYYGISNHALFISHSNGKGWNFISVSDAIDLDIFNYSIYILTKTGILKADLTGKIQPIPITTLETSSTYTEMVVNDGYVFCIMDKRYIIRYSLTTKTQTKTDVITMYNQACSHCTHLAHLKKNKNELYISIYLNMSGDIFTTSLCTTTDSGVTYKPLTRMGAEFTGYTFDDSTMYAVRTRELRVPFLTAFSTDCYRVSSTNVQHLSVNDTIPDRHISYSEESFQRAQEFNDVIKIHDSILIAVGNKKLITRSTNSGKHWNTISYFNGSVNTLEHITCPTENLMYVKGVVMQFTTPQMGELHGYHKNIMDIHVQ